MKNGFTAVTSNGLILLAVKKRKENGIYWNAVKKRDFVPSHLCIGRFPIKIPRILKECTQYTCFQSWGSLISIYISPQCTRWVHPTLTSARPYQLGEVNTFGTTIFSLLFPARPLFLAIFQKNCNKFILQPNYTVNILNLSSIHAVLCILPVCWELVYIFNKLVLKIIVHPQKNLIFNTNKRYTNGNYF